MYMRRVHQYVNGAEIVETYTANWLVGFSSSQNPLISIRSGSEWIQTEGSVGIFLPPFSIVGWRLRPGLNIWEALVSDLPLPTTTPTEPVLFKWNGIVPSGVSETFELLSHLKNPVVVRQQRQTSSLALAIKRRIDESFTDELKISEVAAELDVSRVVMTRLFQRVYGLAPVEYRHRLRIFEALRLMNAGCDVTTALFSAGFSDPSQAIHHFKSILNATPSRFRP